MKNLGLLIIPVLLFADLAIANCPVCAIAAGAGVAAARFYGIDDSIVGVFLGALIISSALWLNKWLKKKNFNIREMVIVIISFLLFVVPFYFSGIIMNIERVKAMPEVYSMFGLGIFGMDKLLIGTIIGSLFVWGSFGLSGYIKKTRGEALYPYQSISFMIMTLVILSVVLWRVTS